VACVDHEVSSTRNAQNRDQWYTKFYRQLQKQHAAATLQATLKRHVVTRCEDPRHTSRTNTPGEGPVLCYKSCHNHPKRVYCRATRTEYFNRIIAKHGRKKRGRAWA